MNCWYTTTLMLVRIVLIIHYIMAIYYHPVHIVVICGWWLRRVSIIIGQSLEGIQSRHFSGTDTNYNFQYLGIAKQFINRISLSSNKVRQSLKRLLSLRKDDYLLGAMLVSHDHLLTTWDKWNRMFWYSSYLRHKTKALFHLLQTLRLSKRTVSTIFAVKFRY